MDAGSVSGARLGVIAGVAGAVVATSIALLAPLYLMAPAVAALPAELVQPAYRVALWSWTPFRFSTETLRSLLFLDGSAPDVATGIIIFAALALAGLVVLLWPARHGADAVGDAATAAPQPVAVG